MLLVHQAGSVKVGELVRYTLTYTPSNDRILPTPAHLYLKVKNTAAIPLRAAWLHGPYVLHVATYPATFNPHKKVEQPDKYGVPEYEPMLKAGGSWQTKLTVPDEIRETGADLGKRRVSSEQPGDGQEGKGSMTWIIEVTSQILFSTSASVNFEVLVGRDERSLDLGFAAVAGHGHGAPGQIRASQISEKERKRAKKQGNVMTAGVYSKAVRLVAEDTEALWDKPGLPSWEDQPQRKPTDHDHKSTEDSMNDKQTKRRKKLHLVVLTHGLHSNLGADMLFLKESIDATVKQARMDAKERKAKYRQQERERRGEASESEEGAEKTKEDVSTAPLSGGQEDLEGGDEGDEDEEETIVRGFTGNAIRTENGIQYLGKRLAKYILRFTYPDQPFLPVKKPLSRTLTDTFKSDADKAKRDGQASHAGSSVHHPSKPGQAAEDLPYKFTSISFVGHSLGGLVQTYAIAYIYKHSPTFFDQIKPVNFICMASPMLGLSNENPLYVKFALDFGLVGKTGQDLGLTWRPNTIARGGWNAMIGGLGAGVKDTATGQHKEDPGAKPLLRILPTGPAHRVLRMFRNRTLYSNVVNDGIVPLRTSCLLFLDWRGLGKVEKARRENGLIGTVAEWGWSELTGANSSTIRPNQLPERFDSDMEEDDEHIRKGEGETVPQPGEDETAEDGRRLSHQLSYEGSSDGEPKRRTSSLGKLPPQQDKGMMATIFDFFGSKTPERAKTPPPTSKKTTKALKRGQTLRQGEDELPEESAVGQDGTTVNNSTMRSQSPHDSRGQVPGKKRPLDTRGDSILNTENGDVHAPPKSSIFESAADILHPPLPSTQWLTDPSTRARTIFHDRVYHPEDIPPPPLKRPGSRLTRSFSSESSIPKTATPSTPGNTSTHSVNPVQDEFGDMKVEEKIARAYHKDLSWRKVLVRLEPDAHNNMIVRRMFANAYGWPVVKHLCDTHFGDTYAARTRDEEEPARERAKPMSEPVSADGGEQVEGQTDKGRPGRSQSEMREARDELGGLDEGRVRMEGSWSSKIGGGGGGGGPGVLRRQDSMGSVVWDDTYLEGSEDEEGDGDDVDERTLVQRLLNPHAVAAAEPTKPEPVHHSPSQQRSDAGSGGVTVPTPAATESHRGLGPRSPIINTSPRTPRTTHPPPARPISHVSAMQVDALPLTPVVSDSFVEEPMSIGSGSATPSSAGPGASTSGTLGLRKSAHGQVLEAGSPTAKSRGGGRASGADV
ncbi:hypothetical protein LTS16_011829 [Friedmanniomyces endolithicus]|nr:hypothetical protein LTS16_011829 [Friedmanniomyces endolithicus]